MKRWRLRRGRGKSKLVFHLYIDIWHILNHTVVRCTCRLLFVPSKPFLLIYVRGCVDTRDAGCGQKEQGTWKFLGTQPGIEPGTYRLMKHCPRRHAGCNGTHTVFMSPTLTVTVAENFSTNIDSVCKLIVAVQEHTFLPNIRTRRGI